MRNIYFCSRGVQMSNDPANQTQCFDVKTEVFFSSEGLHKITESVCVKLFLQFQWIANLKVKILG